MSYTMNPWFAEKIVATNSNKTITHKQHSFPVHALDAQVSRRTPFVDYTTLRDSIASTPCLYADLLTTVHLSELDNLWSAVVGDCLLLRSHLGMISTKDTLHCWVDSTILTVTFKLKDGTTITLPYGISSTANIARNNDTVYKHATLGTVETTLGTIAETLSAQNIHALLPDGNSDVAKHNSDRLRSVLDHRVIVANNGHTICCNDELGGFTVDGKRLALEVALLNQTMCLSAKAIISVFGAINSTQPPRSSSDVAQQICSFNKKFKASYFGYDWDFCEQAPQPEYPMNTAVVNLSASDLITYVRHHI